MQPQGTSASDPDFFAALTARINAIDVCSDLQAAVDEALASVQAEKDAIEAQLAALAPIKLLLELPTDLGSVITWIGNLANHLIAPLVLPIETYTLQLEQLLTEVAALAAAIERAAARLTSCDVIIPPII